MKKALLFLTMTLTFVSANVTVSFNNAKSDKEKEDAFFLQYDLNRDNRLSLQEFPKFLRSKFHVFDKDHNAYVTKLELRASANAKRNQRKSSSYSNKNKNYRSFNSYDRNRDAIISKHEMLGNDRNLFYRLDRNRDGVVTRKEFRQKNRGKVTQRTNKSISDRKSVFSFNHYDRNRDGFIAKHEMSRKLKQQYLRYDFNGDHRLNLAEYRSLLSGKVRQRVKPRQYSRRGHFNSFNYQDLNRDGVITKKEITGSLKNKFYEFDIDGNNKISRSEFHQIKREQNQMENQHQQDLRNQQYDQRQQDMNDRRNQQDYNKKEESPYY